MVSFTASDYLLAQSVYVPLNHWSYEFLERMETRRLAVNIMNSTRPISRQEMAAYLNQVIEKQTSLNRLNAVEKEQLELLTVEFQEELQELGAKILVPGDSRIIRFKKLKGIDQLLPDIVYQNNRNFLSFEHQAFKIWIDPVMSREALLAKADTLENTERVYTDMNGFTFRGKLGNLLSFFFDARDTKEWGTRTYSRQHKITREQLGFVNGYGTHIYHDETVAYLCFKLPYLQIMYGKDKNKWGPGYFGNLALSDYATSYDQLKLQFRYWRFQLTSLTAFLRPYPDIFENGAKLTKSLAAHRLEVNIAPSLQLGLHETVIYGSRRLEPAYLNPIMFYRSAEHYSSYEDNVTMGADFDWAAIRNVKLYGELLIDDITTSKLGTGFYGNKLGYQLGLFYVNAFKLPNLDLRIEYARIRPYVYSHKRAISTYQHFGTNLGHSIGPNSDDLFVQLKYRFSKSLVFESTVEFQRWGANTDSVNYGREVTFSHREQDPTNVSFLGGIFNRQIDWGLKTSYELFRNFYFDVEYFYMNRLNRQNNESRVERNSVLFSMKLNY